MTDQKAVARVERAVLWNALFPHDPLQEVYRLSVCGVHMKDFANVGDAAATAMQINADISQTHVPRSEAEALKKALQDSGRWYCCDCDYVGKDFKHEVVNTSCGDEYVTHCGMCDSDDVEELEQAVFTVKEKLSDLRRVAGDMNQAGKDAEALVKDALMIIVRGKPEDAGRVLREAEFYLRKIFSAFDQIEKESGKGGNRD
jgi:hypothetical protein